MLLVWLACLASVKVVAAEEWILANESNVYGGDYTNIHVHNVSALMDTELACRDLCASTPSCRSYTWTSGPQSPTDECSYTHNCWWRDDDVWHLKSTRNCQGMSGLKGSRPPPSPPPSPPPAGAMNVLFVLFDDLRIMHKPWGFVQPHTPNTNSFAQKSLAFDNAYCQQAVCGPSRASLLSGRRPDTTQMWNFVGSFRDVPGAKAWNTWPEWFKKHGYYSAGCGKLFHPDDPPAFDPPSWSGGKYSGYYGQGSCPIPKNKRTSHGCPVNPHQYPGTKYPDEETLATAKKLLAKAAADRSTPFWIGVGFVKPHMPHVFPEKYLALVPPKEQILVASNPLPPMGVAAAMDWHSGDEGAAVNISASADNATAQDWRVNYYAAAAFSDDLFGQLLAALDSHGLANNTIVVMTSDHGWGLGEHNHWIKYTNWETDARVPLLIHHPQQPHTWGVHTRSLVEHVDLYPTVAELAGVPVRVEDHEAIEGSSYASLFAAGASPATTVWTNAYNASFTQYPRCGIVTTDGVPDFSKAARCAYVSNKKFDYMGYSLRSSRWRYTEWAQWDGATLKPLWMANVTAPGALVELYDHAEDVGPIGARMWNDFENVNVAVQNAEVVQALSARVRAFYNGVEASRGKAYV